MKLFKNKSLIRNQKGFSIVELMIAVFIGIIILTGLVQVFDTSSKMNRTQNGFARIQENGRYAVSLLKQTVEQTGYQYCMGESNADGDPDSQPMKVAWDIKSLPFIPGFGIGAFDPAYLLHGHECGATTCAPNLTSLGSNLVSIVPPNVGTGPGDRIAGTDVITFRYISGPGREVQSISGNTITLTPWQITNTDITLPATGQLLVVDCNEQDVSPNIVTQTAVSANTITVAQDTFQSANLAKVFNMARDFSTVTYYVANNVVDGRDIPTLYSNVNGVTNAVIEGVDAFDIIYGVKDNAGGVRFLDAAGVQAVTGTGCWPAIVNINGGGTPNIPNVAGCGWRSVVSAEVHLLLNSIYNSTNNVNENFRYSQYGNAFYDQSDLPSGIRHYSMHRKEFSTTISLKNIVH